MDEKIVELDRRLVVVEKDVATLKVEVAFVREHFVTKQDLSLIHI